MDAHHPRNVVDGNKNTAWVEGSPDDGIGEWIKLTFTESKKINKIGVIPGYAKTDRIFKANNRVKSATLIFSNGDTQVVAFEDQPEMQYFTITSGKKTAYVKLVINSVYKGTKYQDTCISEIGIKGEE